MVEDFAWTVSVYVETHPRLAAYVLMLLGACLAMVLDRSTREMERARYFALTALILIFSNLTRGIWFASHGAIVGGYLSLIVAADIFRLVAIGYMFGVIAMARSRNAYGHSGRAFLAFIPLANLWLLFTPPRYEAQGKAPSFRLLSGEVGVIIGILLWFVAIGTGNLIAKSVERFVAAIGEDRQVARVQLKQTIRINGIRAAIKQSVSGVKTPMDVDDLVTLTKIEADDVTVRYTYGIKDADAKFDVEVLRSLTAEHNCGDTLARILIDAGARLQHIYLHKDGSEIANFFVVQSACDKEV